MTPHYVSICHQNILQHRMKYNIVKGNKASYVHFKHKLISIGIVGLLRFIYDKQAFMANKSYFTLHSLKFAQKMTPLSFAAESNTCEWRHNCSANN